VRVLNNLRFVNTQKVSLHEKKKNRIVLSENMGETFRYIFDTTAQHEAPGKKPTNSVFPRPRPYGPKHF